MASAMAGLIAAQPAVQDNVQASRGIPSSSIPRQRVSCSRLKLASTWDFENNDPIASGKGKACVVSRVRASASSSPSSLKGEEPSLDLGGGENGPGLNGSGGDGGGGGGGDAYRGKGDASDAGGARGGTLGAFWRGWNDRIRADPQFPFKVLMEEIVGVGACVVGDMASRPNFGLNELDFVFCTLVVGSIVNFSLMYMLAPTTALTARLPGILAACPSGHMFEPGAYSLLDRAGTFLYKGAQFAVVGFAAGLVGTAVSNALLAVRKKLDPEFVALNDAPSTLLNAGTWALHMGLSSNARYQSMNGLEFALASKLPSSVFKTGVLVVRALNNVLGGMSFVALARITGSQKSTPPPTLEDRLRESVDEVVDEAFGRRTD